MGAMGLPGDISPTSRFVRAAFLRNNCYFKDDQDAQITQFFRVLNGVYVVRGSVITQNGQIDETVYSCCYDARRGIYYYSVYDNCATMRSASSTRSWTPRGSCASPCPGKRNLSTTSPRHKPQTPVPGGKGRAGKT